MGGLGSGSKAMWTEELIAKQLREITGVLGEFPTVSELRAMGKNDLVCALTKRGGLIAWASRLGLSRKPSDSDTGWQGEREVLALLRNRGFNAEKMPGVKYPFDLLVDDVLKVDVKSARFASYTSMRAGTTTSGWFYRIGKTPQADLIFLYQLDTKGFFAVPWWYSPSGNISINDGRTKYEFFRDNWSLIEQMVRLRSAERSGISRMMLANVA